MKNTNYAEDLSELQKVDKSMRLHVVDPKQQIADAVRQAVGFFAQESWSPVDGRQSSELRLWTTNSMFSFMSLF